MVDKEHSCWGGAQRNPRYDQDLSRKPRMRATAIGSMMMKWRITKSCRPLRGLDARLRNIPGVPPSATPQAIFCRPHPRAKTYVLRVKMWLKTRLYTAACSAG